MEITFRGHPAGKICGCQKRQIVIGYSDSTSVFYWLNGTTVYWYNKVKSVMIENDSTTSQMDVFYWLETASSLIGELACHVDFVKSGS